MHPPISATIECFISEHNPLWATRSWSVARVCRKWLGSGPATGAQRQDHCLVDDWSEGQLWSTGLVLGHVGCPT